MYWRRRGGPMLSMRLTNHDASTSFQSIKCTECGKVFKNTALANFHAEKSGHDQFEESTEEVCFWGFF
jgi:hypothetical protein